MPDLKVLRASAGAGKTYNLALTYITLLLGKTVNGKLHLFKSGELFRHREILAITFTNKATQEMRSRIVKELACLAYNPAESDYISKLRDLIDNSNEDNDADVLRSISIAAINALDSMLFDIGEMQISTIDSFFQRVLRSFAYEADLAGNYELSLENDQLTNQAISDLLAFACGMKGVVLPKDLNKTAIIVGIKNLIKSQILKGGEYKIFSPDTELRKSIIKFVKHLSDEEYLIKKNKIEDFLRQPNNLKNLLDALQKKRDLFAAEISQLASKILNCKISDYLKATAKQPKTILFDRLVNGEFEKLTESNYRNLLIEPDKTKLLTKDALADTSGCAYFCSLTNDIGHTMRHLCTINSLLSMANYLAFFNEILIVRRNLQAHLNTIMLSDTNELLNRIIDDSPTPFIYERIGRKLSHFLIDEFQDTSKMQWTNLLPLLSESLANGNDNLIIGDVKQCIYRFRNSSPELLANIATSPIVSKYVDLSSLNENWRSSPIVVNFNNTLFSNIQSANIVDSPKADSYNPNLVFQHPRKKDIPGYVSIDLMPGKKNTDYAINRMIENINRQLASGYSPGDIVVLVRTNSNATSVVEVLLEAEKKGQLPAGTIIMSDEALRVGSARSVQWIVNRLHDINAMAKDLSSTNSRGIPRATAEDIDWLQEKIIERNASNKGNSIEEVIADFNAYRLNNAKRNDDKNLLTKGHSLIEVVEKLIGDLPDASMKSSEIQHLCAFHDLILDYCRHKSPTLQEFLKKWDEELANKANVGIADGVNAIRVMTIHKSKGLEFNCVHLPLICKNLDEDSNTRWFDVQSYLESLELNVELPNYLPLAPGSKTSGTSLLYTHFASQHKAQLDDQIIDEINTLYVAFTRAKQELIVTIADPRKSSERIPGKPFPANTPASVLCPIISRMAGQETFPITFGQPTTKYINNNSKTETYDFISKPLYDYNTTGRPYMWSQTKAAQLSDSGDKF